MVGEADELLWDLAAVDRPIALALARVHLEVLEEELPLVEPGVGVGALLLDTHQLLVGVLLLLRGHLEVRGLRHDLHVAEAAVRVLETADLLDGGERVVEDVVVVALHHGVGAPLDVALLGEQPERLERALVGTLPLSDVVVGGFGAVDADRQAVEVRQELEVLFADERAVAHHLDLHPDREGVLEDGDDLRMNEGLPAREAHGLDTHQSSLADRALAHVLVHEERFGGAAAHLAGEVAVLAQGDVHPDVAGEEDVGATLRARLLFQRFAAAHRVSDLGATFPALPRPRSLDLTHSWASTSIFAGGA